jgi:hypothetical protein
MIGGGSLRRDNKNLQPSHRKSCTCGERVTAPAPIAGRTAVLLVVKKPGWWRRAAGCRACLTGGCAGTSEIAVTTTGTPRPTDCHTCGPGSSRALAQKRRGEDAGTLKDLNQGLGALAEGGSLATGVRAEQFLETGCYVRKVKEAEGAEPTGQ